MHSIFCCCSLLTFFMCTATLLFSSSAMCDPKPGPSASPDLIILTDMQPDDRIALAMVANRAELSKRLLFVGTTLLNTQLKAALAKRQLEQSGLRNVPVYAGTGGPPSSYPKNLETAKAALTFWQEEGKGILTKEQLKKFTMIDPNESDLLAEKTKAKLNPLLDIWSIVIEGLPEFNPENQEGPYYHQHDDDSVIRLLDMLDIGVTPKYIYRMPKTRKIPTDAPHPVKVVFPISTVTPDLLKNWNAKQHEIKKENGFSELKIDFAMNLHTFEEAKERFKGEDNVTHHSGKEGRRKKKRQKKEKKFFDTDTKFDDEHEEIEYETDGEEIFHDGQEEFGQSGADDIHQQDENKGCKMDRNEAYTRLAGINFLMIPRFMNFEEKGRSIIIKSLPEHSNNGNEQMIPPALPSQRYKGDFEAVMDFLFAIGVEVSPLGVHRMSFNFKRDERARRHLQVIFGSVNVAQAVLRSWKRLWFLTRFRKREWNKLDVQEFKNKITNPTGDKIENKQQLSVLLGCLQEQTTHVQTVSKAKRRKKTFEQQKKNVPRNELQSALIDAFSKAKENTLEILLMTAPIDLVQVLESKPELAKAIHRVHLMGGWVELKPPKELPLELRPSEDYVLPPPPPTIWGNYNLNMTPESSRRLFEMASVDKILSLRLYTYRHVWEMFQGSINRNAWINVKQHEINVIERIMKSQSHVFREFRKVAKSWDEHAMKLMPYLNRFIAPFAGEQFSPADPILVIGLLKSTLRNTPFIKETRPVKVHIKHEQLEMANDVLEVQIEYDQPNSSIELITGIGSRVFKEELGRCLEHCYNCQTMGHIAKKCPRKLKEDIQLTTAGQPGVLGNPLLMGVDDIGHWFGDVRPGGTRIGTGKGSSRQDDSLEGGGKQVQTCDVEFMLEDDQFPALDTAKKPRAAQQQKMSSKQKAKATNRDENAAVTADAKKEKRENAVDNRFNFNDTGRFNFSADSDWPPLPGRLRSGPPVERNQRVEGDDRLQHQEGDIRGGPTDGTGPDPSRRGPQSDSDGSGGNQTHTGAPMTSSQS